MTNEKLKWAINLQNDINVIEKILEKKDGLISKLGVYSEDTDKNYNMIEHYAISEDFQKDLFDFLKNKLERYQMLLENL